MVWDVTMASFATQEPVMHRLKNPALRIGAAVALSSTLACQSAQAAEAQASAEITIHAPAARVWRLLTDLERWPEWNPAVASVAMQGPFREGSTFIWNSQGFQVASTLGEIDPPKRLSWTGAAFGTKAFHLWQIEAVGDTVRVQTFETFDGWVPWLFKASMQKKLDETLPAWLQALKQAAERRRD
jgi:uncharacterized protein YndB with AHSA1/START domain